MQNTMQASLEDSQWINDKLVSLKSHIATHDFEMLTLKKAYQRSFTYVSNLESENEAFKN